MRPLIRASGLDDLFRCHGSRLVRARVGGTTGKMASAGNWCHYEAATRLVGGFSAIHLDEHGKEAALEKPALLPGWKPTWFDIWMVDFYVGVIRDTMDADMFLEVELALAWDFKRFTLTGHPDAFAISPDGRFAKAWDFKRGEVPVDPADENWQVMSYIVLLFLSYEALREVTFYVVQPRNDPDDGWDRVSEACVKREALDGLIESLEAEVGQALDHEMSLHTGWKQCRYCAGATQCPAIKKLDKAMKHQMDTGELEAIVQDPAIEPLMEMYLSLKTLAAVHERAKDEVGARVDAAGGALTFGAGQRAYFKESNGGRVCQDMKAARQRLEPVIGIEAYDGCTKLKFDAAEKATAVALTASSGKKVPVKSEVPGRASGASELKQLLAGIVEQKTKRTLMIE